MPFTPFHLIAGVGIKAIAPKKISYTSFVIANVVIDMEVLIRMSPFVDMHREPWEPFHLHGAIHSFFYATIIGLVIYAFMRKRRGAFWGAMIGGWSHIVFDMFNHPDIYPFLLFSSDNPFYGMIPPGSVQWICLAIGLLCPAFLWKDVRGFADIKKRWSPD